MDNWLDLIVKVLPASLVLISGISGLLQFIGSYIYADKLERHLQSSAKRFFVSIVPQFLCSIGFFIVFIAYILIQYGEKTPKSNAEKTLSGYQIFETIFILSILFIVLMILTHQIFKAFKRNQARLWYIEEDYQRIYLVKKSGKNKILCHIVSLDAKKEDFTRSFLSADEIVFPTEILLNSDLKINILESRMDIINFKEHFKVVHYLFIIGSLAILFGGFYFFVFSTGFDLLNLIIFSLIFTFYCWFMYPFYKGGFYKKIFTDAIRIFVKKNRDI
ncbi:hypothetical protein HCA60_02840 [Listeria booriae]|uniref:hypothetical protein n=1 Tax=Listeria booriae TaxID=1552123 RepID=UPI00162AB8D2|nr:hypothetical protein [Listeria booriae]MBC1811426.1 hypothetical protein [Listeria booriae]